jgi:hypothetical protein
MRPVAQANGHDHPWLIDQLVPGVARVVEDVAIGLEDPVGQPVVAQELPDCRVDAHDLPLPAVASGEDYGATFVLDAPQRSNRLPPPIDLDRSDRYVGRRPSSPSTETIGSCGAN